MVNRFGVNKFGVWILAGLVNGGVSAACNDSVLAQCKDFELLSTICRQPNLAGDVSDENLSAVYHDSAIGKVTLDSRPTEDLNVYHGVINGETDVYVVTEAGATEFSVFTVEGGRRGPLTVCRN